MNKPTGRRARRAVDIPQHEVDKWQAMERHTWINIAKLFEVSIQSIKQSWRAWAGFPEKPDPQAIIDFMKVHQAGSDAPTSESMEDVREQRERKELEKVERQVDKLHLEVQREMGNLYVAAETEKAIGAMIDTVTNCLIRLDGISISNIEEYWLKKYKEQPPRKFIQAIRETSRDTAEAIAQALSDEGEEMKANLAKGAK